MDREARLGDLAASILEGAPVDWDAVESTASPEDLVVIRQLRVLHEVAALHRGLSNADAATTAVPAPAPAMWGHLRLLEVVGRGSFGEVYRAWDAHLEREVALKLLRADAASGDASATLSDPTRIVHEGRLLARVRHPHVITVYGAEPRDGRVGIWMEFIRGTTLHQLVERQGRLGAREAVAIGTDLCGALAAVHHAGLLHRDISARNVMREDGGRVVLMDFGAGHEHHARERSTGVTGTPLYMAPELFTGGGADQRSDIYALGTVIFHLVSGQYPVAGRSLEEVRAAHARGERTRLRDLRADLPPAFVRAVEQALEPDPLVRFQTAGELEAALDGIDRADHRTPDVNGRRWRAGAAATALSITLAAAVAYLGRGGAGPPSTQSASATAGSALTTRRIDPPRDVWPFSNPSDDGRFVVGMANDTGDAVLVDLVTGEFRTLGLGHSHEDGYASMGLISPDGRVVAVDFHDARGGHLYVVGADGGRPRMLIRPPADVAPQQWSRDGSMILALIERADRTTVAALIAVSDGAVRELFDVGRDRPGHLALSPDNRYVAYDAPNAAGADRDLFIFDAHTGSRWALDAAPGEDVTPFWTPDGRALVFLSERNRHPSLWMARVDQGRLVGSPQLLKDGLGRVFLRGFTADGTLHYDLAAGFVEVHVASIDGAQPPQAVPLSPQRAVSNFYPMWSPDGRFVAYAAQRGELSAARAVRALWVYDAVSGTESAVPFDEPIARPLGWSSDSREILVGGANTTNLDVVDRVSGRSRRIATDAEGRIVWGQAGIVLGRKGRVMLVDPATGRTRRDIGQSKDYVVSGDGRLALSKAPNGQVTLIELTTGVTRQWTDAVEWVGFSFAAPHTRGVAYVAARKTSSGQVRTLMYWPGSGDPREILRVGDKERFALVGWLPDGQHLLAVRGEVGPTPAGQRDAPVPMTLWKVSISGGAPLSLGLTMDGLRDVSLHPDGQRVAFNAGARRLELWALENVLPSPND